MFLLNSLRPHFTFFFCGLTLYDIAKHFLLLNCTLITCSSFKMFLLNSLRPCFIHLSIALGKSHSVWFWYSTPALHMLITVDKSTPTQQFFLTEMMTEFSFLDVPLKKNLIKLELFSVKLCAYELFWNL